VSAGASTWLPFERMPFTCSPGGACLVALIALVLMVTSFELATAFLIGANAALLFSLVLIVWCSRLSAERIVWTEAWRMLKPNQRPAGGAGRSMAYRCLSETALRFAKAASAVAIALSASALMLAGE
jgi:hypothetical protein